MTLQIEAPAAALASATSAAGALAVSAPAPTLDLGLPLPMILAAFAGAALILSFLPPRLDADGHVHGRGRMLATIAFCTLLGTLLGPSVGVSFGLTGKGILGAAFALGALGQVLIPVLIEKRNMAVDRLFSWLPRQDPGDKGGGGAP